MSFEDYLRKKEVKSVKKKIANTRDLIKEESNMGRYNDSEVIKRIDDLEDKLDLILDTLIAIVEGLPEEASQKEPQSLNSSEEGNNPLHEMFNRQTPTRSNVQQQVHDTTFAAANLFEDTESLDESAISSLSKQADISLLSTRSNVPIPAKTDVVDLAGAAAILG